MRFILFFKFTSTGFWTQITFVGFKTKLLILRILVLPSAILCVFNEIAGVVFINPWITIRQTWIILSFCTTGTDLQWDVPSHFHYVLDRIKLPKHGFSGSNTGSFYTEAAYFSPIFHITAIRGLLYCHYSSFFRMFWPSIAVTKYSYRFFWLKSCDFPETEYCIPSFGSSSEVLNLIATRLYFIVSLSVQFLQACLETDIRLWSLAS